MNSPDILSESPTRSGTVLRKKAEDLIINKNAAKGMPQTEGGILKLLHELEVHRIELEMQNDELRTANDSAIAATDKFTALYDFAPAGYFTIKRDGTLYEMNLTGASMLGMDRSALMNKSFRHFITSDTRTIFNDFLQDIYKTNTKQTCRVQLLQNEKPPIYVHFDGIYSENKEYCLITGIDITRQQLMERKLQSSETRYRRLFESAKDGILILDAETGKIVDLNPYLIKKIGYSYDELLGKELWEIGIFKNIAASKEAFIKLQINEYIRFEDMPLETKTGKHINVEFVSNVYLVDDKKVIQCNIRDITDRKKAERDLIKSETSLRELNASKDKFFSIISHDLRSPFNSIIGYSNIMVEQIRAKDYEALEEYATIIQKASWQAMDLLVNLLEWSRSQSGRISFNPEEVNLFALINEVTELLFDSAQQKSISISIELPEYYSVYADKNMINTVLRNLITNAIKFSNPGGKIVISAKQKNNEAVVSIHDSGIGIKKEAIEKLFRIEESYTTIGTQNEEGTGLGLLICKEFVSRHGGKIWVQSQPGKGSRFLFTLAVI